MPETEGTPMTADTYSMLAGTSSPAPHQAEPWSDTGTSTGHLMIAVLGDLAGAEHDLIRTRTAEGRSRAQKRGSIWAGPRNSPTRRKWKHGGGQREPLSPNSRLAMNKAPKASLSSDPKRRDRSFLNPSRHDGHEDGGCSERGTRS